MTLQGLDLPQNVTSRPSAEIESTLPRSCSLHLVGSRSTGLGDRMFDPLATGVVSKGTGLGLIPASQSVSPGVTERRRYGYGCSSVTGVIERGVLLIVFRAIGTIAGASMCRNSRRAEYSK